jgi:hypothetical protein
VWVLEQPLSYSWFDVERKCCGVQHIAIPPSGKGKRPR